MLESIKSDSDHHNYSITQNGSNESHIFETFGTILVCFALFRYDFLESVPFAAPCLDAESRIFDLVAQAVLPMDIFNHTSFDVTRCHLGIAQDDRDRVYLSLELA